MDIHKILKGIDITIPEEKTAEFEKVFRENWKSKSEVEAKDTKITNLEEDIKAKDNLLKDANETIASYKDMDIDAIKKSSEEYKLKYEEQQAKFESEIAKRDRLGAIRDKIYNAGIEFTSDYAKTGVINDLMSNENLTIDDKGNLVGFDDIFKSVKETQPKAFVEKQKEDDKKTPPPMYAGAGKDPITPTEADTLKKELENANKSRNMTEVARITRIAQEKGVDLN